MQAHTQPATMEALAPRFVRMEEDFSSGGRFSGRQGSNSAPRERCCRVCPLEMGLDCMLLPLTLWMPFQISGSLQIMGVVSGVDWLLAALQIPVAVAVLGANLYALDALGWVVCGPRTADAAPVPWRLRPPRAEERQATALSYAFRANLLLLVLNSVSLVLFFTYGETICTSGEYQATVRGCYRWPPVSAMEGRCSAGEVDETFIGCKDPAATFSSPEKCSTEETKYFARVERDGSGEDVVRQVSATDNWATWTPLQRAARVDKATYGCEVFDDGWYLGLNLLWCGFSLYFVRIVMGLKEMLLIAPGERPDVRFGPPLENAAEPTRQETDRAYATAGHVPRFARKERTARSMLA